MRWLGWMAGAILLAAAPGFAGPPDAGAARAFVTGLYAHYPQKAGGPMFEPTDKNVSDVFDPGMAAAFREDRRLAKGEVGFVDADPICQCQDDSGMTTKIVSVTMQGANAATVLVSIHYPNDPPTPLTLHLVPVKGAWRIHDLSSPGMNSYRADLLKANRDAAARRP